MRLTFSFFFCTFFLIACGSDAPSETVRASQQTEVTKLEERKSPSGLISTDICKTLSESLLQTAIPQAGVIKAQKMQGSSDIIRCGAGFILDSKPMIASITHQEDALDKAGFLRMKDQMQKMSEAVGGTPPAAIKGLGDNAYVVGGIAGKVEYYDEGDLWRITVQDKENNTYPELAVALLNAMLAE